MTNQLHPSVSTRPGRRGDQDRQRSVLAALYAGLTMTVVATVAPYVDRATSHGLEDHIRAGYPSYTQARLDTAVTTYEAILTVIGVVAAASWIVVIRAAAARKRWTAPLATTVFVLGLGIALGDLLIKDTSGETGLSPLLGWLGLLPCLPGLLAVTLLWRRP